MLAFSNDYYGMIFRATQSVELFCAYAEKHAKQDPVFQSQPMKDLGIYGWLVTVNLQKQGLYFFNA